MMILKSARFLLKRSSRSGKFDVGCGKLLTSIVKLQKNMGGGLICLERSMGM